MGLFWFAQNGNVVSLWPCGVTLVRVRSDYGVVEEFSDNSACHFAASSRRFHCS